MKAKFTWSILLLMAIGLAGSSKNFCGKNCPPGCVAIPGTAEPVNVSAAIAPAEEDTGSETPGISPINLLIFQFK